METEMMGEITDQELLQRYAQGRDEAAFGRLVTRHLNLAVGTAFRILNDSGLAQDAAQAAFIALAREARSLGRHPAIDGWLHKTVVNLARAPVHQGYDSDQNTSRLAGRIDRHGAGHLPVAGDAPGRGTEPPNHGSANPSPHGHKRAAARHQRLGASPSPYSGSRSVWPAGR